MFWMRSAGMRSGHNGLKSHQSHQPGNPLFVHQPSCPLQLFRHPGRSEIRTNQIYSVYRPHQFQVLRTFAGRRRVVITRPRQPGQDTLLNHRQTRMFYIYPLPFDLQRNVQSFFLSQLTSIFNRPISSYKGAVISSSLIPLMPAARLKMELPPIGWTVFRVS